MLGCQKSTALYFYNWSLDQHGGAQVLKVSMLDFNNKPLSINLPMRQKCGTTTVRIFHCNKDHMDLQKNNGYLMCFHIVGHSPGQVTPMVQQKTDGTDGNDDQEYLLLPHLWEAEGKRDGE